MTRERNSGDDGACRHVFEIMDPDGGGNGSVVTGTGSPRLGKEIAVSREYTPNGEAVTDHGPEQTKMVGEGGNNHGQY